MVKDTTENEIISFLECKIDITNFKKIMSQNTANYAALFTSNNGNLYIPVLLKHHGADYYNTVAVIEKLCTSENTPYNDYYLFTIIKQAYLNCYTMSTIYKDYIK